MFADVGERESGVEGMADPVILFEDRGREIAATDDFVDQFGLLGPGPGKVGSSVIVAGDLAEVGSHPCRDERKVLKELLAGRDGQVGSDAAQVLWGDLVLADIPQSLGDESTGAAGEPEQAAGIAAEVDLELAEGEPRGCSVGVIDQSGGHLGAESELIGGEGGGGEQAEVALAHDGIDDGIRAGSHLAEQGMEVGLIVEAMADAVDLAAADEAGQGHADGTVITQVGEIVRGEFPTPSSRGDAAQDLLRMSGCGDFHVENNARVF